MIPTEYSEVLAENLGGFLYNDSYFSRSRLAVRRRA